MGKLAKCGLAVDATRELFACLGLGHWRLRKLDLSYNPDFGDAGMEELAGFLREDSSLKHLNLNWTGCSDVGFQVLFEALSKPHPSLTELHLRWNPGLTDDAFQSISACLKKNHVLKTVIISQQSGMSKHASDELSVHPRMKVLNESTR